MEKEIKEISDYLNTTCSNNPAEIQKKSDEIQNMIIRIAKENCLSAKVQNALLDSIAEDECYLVDRLDRLNASCTHQLDSLRSLLSYEKESLRLNKTGY